MKHKQAGGRPRGVPPSTDTPDRPSPGVLPRAGSPSSIKGRGCLVIDLLESLLRDRFLGPFLQINWEWGESGHLHFPQNCLGDHWTELSAQRVGKEQQGLDTGAPRVLKKERDKLPPYGHLRTGPPCALQNSPVPHRRASSQGNAAKGVPSRLFPRLRPRVRKEAVGLPCPQPD